MGKRGGVGPIENERAADAANDAPTWTPEHAIDIAVDEIRRGLLDTMARVFGAPYAEMVETDCIPDIRRAITRAIGSVCDITEFRNAGGDVAMSVNWKTGDVGIGSTPDRHTSDGTHSTDHFTITEIGQGIISPDRLYVDKGATGKLKVSKKLDWSAVPYSKLIVSVDRVQAPEIVQAPDSEFTISNAKISVDGLYFEDRGCIRTISPSVPLIVNGGMFGNNQTPVQKLDIKSSSDNLDPNDLPSRRLEKLEDRVEDLDAHVRKRFMEVDDTPIYQAARINELTKAQLETDKHIESVAFELEKSQTQVAVLIHNVRDEVRKLGKQADWNVDTNTQGNEALHIAINALEAKQANDIGMVSGRIIKFVSEFFTAHNALCDVAVSMQDLIVSKGALKNADWGVFSSNWHAVKAGIDKARLKGEAKDEEAVNETNAVATADNIWRSSGSGLSGSDSGDTVDEVMAEVDANLLNWFTHTWVDPYHDTDPEKVDRVSRVIRPIIEKLVAECVELKSHGRLGMARARYEKAEAGRDDAKSQFVDLGDRCMELRIAKERAEAEVARLKDNLKSIYHTHDTVTVRQHAKLRRALGGPDAQALEHALTQVEVERDGWHKETLALRKSQEDSDKELRKVKAERDAMRNATLDEVAQTILGEVPTNERVASAFGHLIAIVQGMKEVQ